MASPVLISFTKQLRISCMEYSIRGGKRVLTSHQKENIILKINTFGSILLLHGTNQEWSILLTTNITVLLATFHVFCNMCNATYCRNSQTN
jgi:hypothetical protein